MTTQGGRNIVVSIPGQPTADQLQAIRKPSQLRFRAVLEAGAGRLTPTSTPTATGTATGTSLWDPSVTTTTPAPASRRRPATPPSVAAPRWSPGPG